MSTTTTALPKYVQNANRIITVLAEQPDQKWAKTQRELGEELELSQPELSSLLKTLREQGKIKQGDPLPGVRGRNYVLELVDPELFDGPIVRNTRSERSADRPLDPGEEVRGVVDLGELTLDKVGAAVVRLLRDSWEKEERYGQVRSEQLTRLRDYREKLSEERQLRTRMAEEKEQLERQVQDLTRQVTHMREEINKLLIRANSRPGRGGSDYQLRDLLPDESMRALKNLMEGKPGYYRESDSEVGLSASA